MDIEGWTELAARSADHVLGPLTGPLERSVAEVSHRYTLERTQLDRQGTPDALQARTRFFLPRDILKVFRPLSELLEAGGLPAQEPWRVLDLGAGVGTSGLGVAAFHHSALRADLDEPSEDGRPSRPTRRPTAIEITALDANARALAVYADLVSRLVATEGAFIAASLQLKPMVLELEKTRAWPDGPFDLVLLGLVINELDDVEVTGIIRAIRRRLAPKGSVLIIEPALKEPTRRLHRLRVRLIEEGWTVFGPCLHQGPCPMLAAERDWCHRDEPNFRLPASLQAVARGAGLRDRRLTFADLSLRTDGLSLERARPEATDRVVSQIRISKGKVQLFGCARAPRGDGPRRHHRSYEKLKRHRSLANADLEASGRGELVSIKGSEAKDQTDRVISTTKVQRLLSLVGPTSH